MLYDPQLIEEPLQGCEVPEEVKREQFRRYRADVERELAIPIYDHDETDLLPEPEIEEEDRPESAWSELGYNAAPSMRKITDSLWRKYGEQVVAQKQVPEHGTQRAWLRAHLAETADCYDSVNGVPVGTLHVYENEIQLKRVGNVKTGGGLRGVIKGFSDESRKRLISKLNRLCWPAGPVIFLSLTYPDNFERDPKEVKRHLSMLRKRFLRRYPDCGVIWRLERVPRKSGANTGEIAPHFHLFVFNIPLDQLNEIEPRATEKDSLRCVFWFWLRQAWSEIIDAPGRYKNDADRQAALEHGTNARLVNNRSQAQYYITKYMSKDEGYDLESGRIWDEFGKLDFSAYFSLSITNLHLHLLRLLIAQFFRAQVEKLYAAARAMTDRKKKLKALLRVRAKRRFLRRFEAMAHCGWRFAGLGAGVFGASASLLDIIGFLKQGAIDG